MEPTCFILLRHGETEANKAGILQGWYESPLDENGIRQVECAAEYAAGQSDGASKTLELSLGIGPAGR